MSASTHTSPAPAAPAHALRRAIALLGVNPRRVAASITWGSLALGCSVALSAVSAWLIARASQMPLVLDLSIAVVAVRAFGIGRGVFRYVERLASHSVALDGMVNLRERLYALLAAGRSDAIVGLRRGDLLARVGADVDSVGDVVVRGLIPAGVAAVVSTGSVVAMWCFLPLAGITLAACLLLAGVVAPWLSWRSARAAEDQTSVAKAQVSADALTLLDGADELQVAGTIDAAYSRLNTDETALARALDHTAAPAAWAVGVAQVAQGLAVLAAFLVGIPALHSGALAPVELAVIVLTPLAAFEPVNALPGAAAQVLRSRAAARRVMALVDLAEQPHDQAAAAPAPETTTGTGQARRYDSALGLCALDLSCAWPGALPVVSGLDLQVRPGRTVAIVGPSGAGKTTALATIAGLLPPAAGAASVDGRPTWELSSEERADLVAMTAEDAHVFATTVLDNLRVARGDLSPEEAGELLAAVGMSGWLTQLDSGLDTMLGPGGTTVSGGERRRLLLARALASRARYWLIDEPGEHLDMAGARALMTTLVDRARQDKHGLVIVTHRYAGLEDVDEVVVLEAGHVRCRGTHTELLTSDAGYAWAWQTQQTAPA